MVEPRTSRKNVNPMADPAAVPGDQCTDRRGVGSRISKFVCGEMVYSSSYSSECIVTMFHDIIHILCTYHMYIRCTNIHAIHIYIYMSMYV